MVWPDERIEVGRDGEPYSIVSRHGCQLRQKGSGSVGPGRGSIRSRASWTRWLMLAIPVSEPRTCPM